MHQVGARWNHAVVVVLLSEMPPVGQASRLSFPQGFASNIARASNLGLLPHKSDLRLSNRLRDSIPPWTDPQRASVLRRRHRRVGRDGEPRSPGGVVVDLAPSVVKLGP